MLDVEKLKRMYDDAVECFGEPPISFALFDRRILFPRSMMVDQVERETGRRIAIDILDEMAYAGLFSWLEGAGDGSEVGVPLYVPARLGLFAELESKRWTREELRDFADWEEWVVDDCLSDEDLRYEDSDVATVARQVRLDLGNLNDEMWGRVPLDQAPKGWLRTSWISTLASLTTEELSAQRDRLEVYLRRVEATDLATASERWRHHVRRAAFCIRFWEESVRVMLIAGDRAKLEAGFSPAICLWGEHSIVPQVAQLEQFGRVDWQRTLHAWRFLQDPDHFPLRLPGFVLIGGTVTLDGLLSPGEYGRRYELFHLEEYVSLFKKVAAGRRCAHCSRLLANAASERRRYCSGECSQAARQKSYRRRQKELILRRRRSSPE